MKKRYLHTSAVSILFKLEAMIHLKEWRTHLVQVKHVCQYWLLLSDQREVMVASCHQPAHSVCEALLTAAAAWPTMSSSLIH